MRPLAQHLPGFRGSPCSTCVCCILSTNALTFHIVKTLILVCIQIYSECTNNLKKIKVHNDRVVYIELSSGDVIPLDGVLSVLFLNCIVTAIGNS